MPDQRQAEPHYPVCVRTAARRQRFGRQLKAMYARLDETCSIEGWTNCAGKRHWPRLNHALFQGTRVRVPLSWPFRCGYWIGTITGAFIMRNDERPGPRAASLRKTPEPLRSPRLRS